MSTTAIWPDAMADRAPAEAMSEQELAQAFAARDGAAFAEAYRRHAPILHAVARQILGGASEAEDCVHDALLRMWTAATYRTERGVLRAFLIVCVRNEALSRRRAAIRHAQLEAAAARAEHVASDETLERSDPIERARIASALAALPGEQRRVIELAYFGGRTQTEIAGALDIPLGTVKSRASLALRKLALALSP